MKKVILFNKTNGRHTVIDLYEGHGSFPVSSIVFVKFDSLGYKTPDSLVKEILEFAK